MIRITRINTPLGEMVAGATEKGICLLEFSDRSELSSELSELSKLLETQIKGSFSRHFLALRKQLKEYFKGRRKEFSVPLVTPGTEFQQAVWREIRTIPYGSTKSYSDQAKSLNNPASVRAVANANGANRISIIIPCHRVIGSDGSLVGYGGGLHRKRWLLDHERKYSGQPVDISLF
jgi:AraC family transcriptional regulator of adaptative response/methylated-DNA-[protein]-cysteine methyltransferase